MAGPLGMLTSWWVAFVVEVPTLPTPFEQASADCFASIEWMGLSAAYYVFDLYLEGLF
jgi:hypothetical protein